MKGHTSIKLPIQSTERNIYAKLKAIKRTKNHSQSEIGNSLDWLLSGVVPW